MAFALSIMKNHLPFPFLRENRCIIAFGCGAGGNVLTFVMEYENYTFQEALQSLADRAGVTLAEDGIQQRSQRTGRASQPGC